MIVVDASAVATALGDGGAAGRAARARLSGERLAAPALLDLEVVSAWRRLAAAGRLSSDRVEQAITDLVALPIERVRHGPLLERCWQLSDAMMVCDAAYVALAEALDAVLVTADRRLASVPGARCPFDVLA